MLCKRCGKEVGENAKYCIFCGLYIADNIETEKEIKEAVVVSEKQELDIVLLAKTWCKKIKNWIVALTRKERWLLATIALLLINPFLANADNFEFSDSYRLYIEKQSFFDVLHLFSEELSWVSYLIFGGITAIVVAEIMMIYPWMKGKTLKAKSVLLTKIIAILALASMLFFTIPSYIEAAHEETVQFGLTFGGVLFIAESIALIIVSFKASAIIKKEVIIPETSENSEITSQY